MAFPLRQILLAMAVVLAFFGPAMALDLEEDMDFGPLTSAEQAELFEQGITAYDAGDFATAFDIWLPLAQTGNMSAQRNVANMLRRGIGTEQDLTRAVYFYRRAADTGLVNAMVNLGNMIRLGEGVDAPNDHEAASWFYTAARAGDPRAQYALGVMAALGQGMETNRDGAEQLLRLAARQGLRDAQLRLAESGLELEPLDDPDRPQFNLPPELEPAPGISLAPYLTPSQTVPAGIVVEGAEPGERPTLRLTLPAPIPEAEPSSEIEADTEAEYDPH